MKKLLSSRSFYVSLALGVIVFVISLLFVLRSNQPPERITTTVETGAVRQIVSVSGTAETERTAQLSFPVTGIVQSVEVQKGDVVAAGDVLMRLDTAALMADRQDALAAIARAQADLDELLTGATDSARDVTAETLQRARENLIATEAREAQKIENAYRTLLSSGLTAYSNDPGEDAIAPTVSGTYACEIEGTYVIEVFNSNTDSGYSYRLSGIETGTFPVSVLQPSPLGECGLRILFDSTSTYGRTEWTIDIPNTKSSSYVTNRNAHALALTQAESAIDLAKRELALAEANANNANAPARAEAVTRAEATIAQARARLARIDATIADRILRAPFAGTVTDAPLLPGETVSTAPVITMIGDEAFEVTARIPEIDIGKINVGQEVELRFDARNNEIMTGTIRFLSLTATEIDGVAYYEAITTLDETPAWLRSGLNADVDIIINELTDSLRIPTRFITETDGEFFVLVQTGVNEFATTTVSIALQGNDGYVAITGLKEGDTVVAP